jgi:hypothetical protein
VPGLEEGGETAGNRECHCQRADIRMPVIPRDLDLGAHLERVRIARITQDPPREVSHVRPIETFAAELIEIVAVLARQQAQEPGQRRTVQQGRLHPGARGVVHRRADCSAVGNYKGLGRYEAFAVTEPAASGALRRDIPGIAAFNTTGTLPLTPPRVPRQKAASPAFSTRQASYS